MKRSLLSKKINNFYEKKNSNNRLLLIWVVLLYTSIFAYLTFIPYSYGVGYISPAIVTPQGDIKLYSYFGAMSPKEYFDYIYLFWTNRESMDFYPGPLFPFLINWFRYSTNPLYLSLFFAVIGGFFQYLVCSWLLLKHHIALFPVLLISLNPYILLYSFIPSPDLLLAFISFLFFSNLLDGLDDKSNIKFICLIAIIGASIHPIGIMLTLYLMLYLLNSKVDSKLIKIFAVIVCLFWILFYLPYLKAMILAISTSPNASISFNEFWKNVQIIFILEMKDFLSNVSISTIRDKIFIIYGFQDSLTGNTFHQIYRFIFGLIMLGGTVAIFFVASRSYILFTFLLMLPTILTYPSTRYLMPVMPILCLYFFKCFRKF